MKNQKQIFIYQVEKILARKIIDGKLHYRVKWAGYQQSQSTWQPLINLMNAHKAISLFESSKKSNTLRKQTTNKKVTKKSKFDVNKIFKKKQNKTRLKENKKQETTYSDIDEDQVVQLNQIANILHRPIKTKEDQQQQVKIKISTQLTKTSESIQKVQEEIQDKQEDDE